MFHAVNGDRMGNGRSGLNVNSLTPPDVSMANKGDRGFSDQTEARIFLIGTPAKERPARA